MEFNAVLNRSSSSMGAPTDWECVGPSTGRLLSRPGRFPVPRDLGVERKGCLVRGRPRVLAFIDVADVGISDFEASESTSVSNSDSLASANSVGR